MVQGVLYCEDDKKLTNAVELCIICQWEWKIWGGGTSIKIAISTWRYWTVWISHPLWGISEGQINARFFFFPFFIRRPAVTVCLKVIISWWMGDCSTSLLSGRCPQVQYLREVKSFQDKSRWDAYCYVPFCVFSHSCSIVIPLYLIVEECLHTRWL